MQAVKRPAEIPIEDDVTDLYDDLTEEVKEMNDLIFIKKPQGGQLGNDILYVCDEYVKLYIGFQIGDTTQICPIRIRMCMLNVASVIDRLQ